MLKVEEAFNAPPPDVPWERNSSRSASAPIRLDQHGPRFITQSQPRLERRLSRTGTPGASDAWVRRLQTEFEHLLAAANGHLNSLRLADVSRRFDAVLPGAAWGESVCLNSDAVPGSALGERFPAGAVLRDTSHDFRIEYKHTPHLARTALTDAQGRTIYAGLRHGAIDPDIDRFRLSRIIADATRSQMAQDLLPPDHPYHSRIPFSEEKINAECSLYRIGADQLLRAERAAILENSAPIMRSRAGRNMAREVAAAALAANPQRLRQALDGQPVCLVLFQVVLKPHDPNYDLRLQRNEFAALATSSPVPLRVRGADGRPCTVRVYVKVRQFLVDGFGTRPEGSPASQDRAYSQLLGDPGPGIELGGDVKARIREMNAAAAEVRSNVRTLETTLKRLGRKPQGEAVRERIRSLKNELPHLENNIRALQGAGKQLKLLRHLPNSDVKPEQVGALLALVGHLMGETPVLTACRSGASKTLHLDAAVKFLAAVASTQGGHVPTIERQRAADWVRAYEPFRAQVTGIADSSRHAAIDEEFSAPPPVRWDDEPSWGF
ncbi:MAG: hypothetical protein OXE40_14140 [Gammaproteobacteria bacterium]|nr:hypothetical protein [Gammaproteobacteria bacterium]